MIQYEKTTLDNGLTVICNTDVTTPFIAVNILYKVGARDENPDRTGLAHLFEHLMFGGSRHVTDFDNRVQQAGGNCNAYTGNDYTNYYTILPAAAIETALWLESDRMLWPKLSPRALRVQKNVVIEEFKQNYLNRPYGDLWLQLRPLAYRVHPYRWNTIGIHPSHVENVTLDEVKNFALSHYAPDNAILSISGNIPASRALELVKRWFGDIPPAAAPRQKIPVEPRQRAPRRLESASHPIPVPSDVICIAYHAGGRATDNFYACDLLSDILADGESSRLHRQLVKRRPLFAELDAYVTGELDPGLILLHGTVAAGTPVHTAERALLDEIQHLVTDGVTPRELQKTAAKIETRLACDEISYHEKAARLAALEYTGDITLVNTERHRYAAIDADTLRRVAAETLRSANSSTLLYLATNR
ncbi:MAG: insulinase family protein [Odoribacteraceae bacterium]|jgi:predicted Zn-dependent peptidase|nr:insulinase family protein [Odoribacteraceae bacterium]